VSIFFRSNFFLFFLFLFAALGMKRFIQRFRLSDPNDCQSPETLTRRPSGFESPIASTQAHGSSDPMGAWVERLTRLGVPFAMWPAGSAHPNIALTSQPPLPPPFGSDAVGRSVVDVLQGAIADTQTLQSILAMLETGATIRGITLAPSDDEEAKWSFFPICDPTGSLTHYIAAFHVSSVDPDEATSTASLCFFPNLCQNEVLLPAVRPQPLYLPTAPVRRPRFGRGPVACSPAKNAKSATVFVTDDLCIAACAGAILTLFGFDEKDLIGQKLSVLLSPEENDDPWSWGGRSRRVLGYQQSCGALTPMMVNVGHAGFRHGNLVLPLVFAPEPFTGGDTTKSEPVENLWDAPLADPPSGRILVERLAAEVREQLAALRVGALSVSVGTSADDFFDTSSATHIPRARSSMFTSPEMEFALQAIERGLDNASTLAELAEVPPNYHFAPHPIRGIVDRSVAVARDLCDVRRIALSVAVDSRLESLMVLYDRDALGSAVRNVLFEALHETATGGLLVIRVEPHPARVAEDHIGIVIRISGECDTTPTTPQCPGALHHRIADIPLAFAVARQVALAHGGDMGPLGPLAGEAHTGYWIRLSLSLPPGGPLERGCSSALTSPVTSPTSGSRIPSPPKPKIPSPPPARDSNSDSSPPSHRPRRPSRNVVVSAGVEPYQLL